MEHIIRFEAGFNCIKFECRYGSESCKPGSGGSHGKHGLQIRFVSKGDAGAIQFVIYTGWIPQFVKPSQTHVRNIDDWGSHMMPADLGYHSKTAKYNGHKPIDDTCEFCDGLPCYYDGSGLNAYDAMYALVNGGDIALWIFLDAYYESVFNGAAYPQPIEYPYPIRQKRGQNETPTS